MEEVPLDFQAFYQTHHRSYLEYALLQSGSKEVALELVEAFRGVRSRLCAGLGPGLSKAGELLGPFDA